MTSQIIRSTEPNFNAVARRGMLAGLGILALAGAGAPPPSDDARFIAISAQYTAVRNAVNTRADLADEDPLWTTYFELRDVIRDWKPTTLEGLVAKARVTKEDATSPSGVEEPGSIQTDWAWDVLSGLVQMVGRA